LSFGVDEKKDLDKLKVNVAFQIDSEEDHQDLLRIQDELVKEVTAGWSTWYPNAPVPSAEVLKNNCYGLVSQRKPKTTGDGEWSGVSKATLEPAECISGKCKIVDAETNQVVPYVDLPGMKWHKIIVELKYIYIQSTKSYGITKKLRYLSCSGGNEDGGEIVPL
jgi:hypothetical protein